MRITENGAGIFLLSSSYEDRAFPKAAGWRWHGRPGSCRSRCIACTKGVPFTAWWTDDPTAAGKLGGTWTAAPEIEARLRAAGGAREEQLAASRAVDAEVEIPVPQGLEYFGYQRAGVAFALRAFARGLGVLFADQMGLGKTIEAIGVINKMLADRGDDWTSFRALVVCPASLRTNWRRELERWLVRPLRLYVVASSDVPPPHADVVIVNYDRLVGAGGRGMRAALLARDYDLLVVDEAHYLKDARTQRSAAVLGVAAKPRKGVEAKPGLVSRARHLAFATGTPILNKPVEAHPLLAALHPAEFGDFFRFARRYCAAQQVRVPGAGLVWDFSGASHLDELQEKLRLSVMVRRLKKDVLTELPAKRRQLVVLDVDDEETVRLIEREKALHAARSPAAEGEVDYARAVARLAEAGAGPAFTEVARVRHDLAVRKVPAVIEHLECLLEADVKTICFAHHHDVIDAICDRFRERSVVVDGRTPMDARQDAVDRFQADPAVRLFVGNIQAAGVGITLTASSHVVFAELDWVPANVVQAEDRAHRIGQQESVMVQHLVLDGSLDARIAGEMVRKQDIADRALDRTAPAAAAEASRAPRAASADNGAPAAPAEPVTAAQRRSAAVAMGILAGNCDGARVLDGAGFSKVDTDLGHKLARLGESMTDGQVRLATKLARRYRRQLPEEVMRELGAAVEDRS